MKQRVNWYECKCGWQGHDLHGSGGYTIDSTTGEIEVTTSKSFCPVCGNTEVTFRSEICDVYLMNAMSV